MTSLLTKIIFVLFFSFSSSLYAKNINNIDYINDFLFSYGYEYLSHDFNDKFIKNTYKIKLKSINENKNNLIPMPINLILSKDEKKGFLLFDWDITEKNKPFNRVKNSLTTFQRNNANREFFKFTLPILGIEEFVFFDNVDHILSTTHSFLIPSYNDYSLIGWIINFDSKKYKNITTEKTYFKKKKEKDTILTLVQKYPEIILKSENFNIDKLIVVLFSESCGYCISILKNHDKYNEKGYSLMILPATELSYDRRFNQNTYKYFCSDIQNNLKNNKISNNCDFSKIEDIYYYKRLLLGGVQYKGTPTIYMNNYQLWYSGFIGYHAL